GAGRAARLTSVTREEDPHVELVPIRFDLFEEALDAGEAAVAVVDESPLVFAELLVGRVEIEPEPLRRLDELTLVPLARRIRPRLHGAVGERASGVGHDAGLVVLEDVTEALALRARTQRVIEREEQGLGTLERDRAGRAAQVLRERAKTDAHDLDLEAPVAFAQRRFDRLADAAALRGGEDDAVEDDRHLAGAIERRGHGREVDHFAAHADARESPSRERCPELGRRLAGRERNPKTDHRPGALVHRKEYLLQTVRSVRGCRLSATRDMYPDHLGLHESHVV